MILSKSITVPITIRNSSYYNSLGYDVPKVNLRNRTKTKLKILVQDLPENSHIKVKCQCDRCGEKNHVTFYSLKSQDYICKKCADEINLPKGKGKNRTYPNGSDHPNFNPNLTNEERLTYRKISGMKTWRKEVKVRDNYTCSKCGYEGQPNDWKMCSHHLNNYKEFKEQRTDINNGITLCQKCHHKLHSMFGKLTTEKDFNQFLLVE